MALPTRARPSFPHSQSLPSESFHMPLFLIHQRAGRMKTTVTENCRNHVILLSQKCLLEVNLTHSLSLACSFLTLKLNILAEKSALARCCSACRTTPSPVTDFKSRKQQLWFTTPSYPDVFFLFTKLIYCTRSTDLEQTPVFPYHGSFYA